jgi:hypothetical protein
MWEKEDLASFNAGLELVLGERGDVVAVEVEAVSNKGGGKLHRALLNNIQIKISFSKKKS